MTEKFKSVKDLMDGKTWLRPMTSKEILMLVEKSQGSIYQELKWLMKMNMLEKIQIQIDPEKRQVLILYKKKSTEE